MNRKVNSPILMESEPAARWVRPKSRTRQRMRGVDTRGEEQPEGHAFLSFLFPFASPASPDRDAGFPGSSILLILLQRRFTVSVSLTHDTQHGSTLFSAHSLITLVSSRAVSSGSQFFFLTFHSIRFLPRGGSISYLFFVPGAGRGARARCFPA